QQSEAVIQLFGNGIRRKVQRFPELPNSFSVRRRILVKRFSKIATTLEIVTRSRGRGANPDCRDWREQSTRKNDAPRNPHRATLLPGKSCSCKSLFRVDGLRRSVEKFFLQP